MSLERRSPERKGVAEAKVHDTTGENERHHGLYVDEKFMGTTADQREMHALGRIQELRVCACQQFRI